MIGSLVDLLGSTLAAASSTTRAVQQARTDVDDLVDLGADGRGVIWLHNTGDATLELIPIEVTSIGGPTTRPPELRVLPRVIGSLAPGASVAVDVVAVTDEATTAGDYAWTLHVDGVIDVVRVVLTVGAGRREPARLRLYGSVVERAADASLPRREPVAHLYDLVRDYPSRAAKHLRPALLLASCEAFGGDVDDALPVAAALELMHNAFLVHDDIEDGSELRRGQPTLHTEHGVPLALNAGDALTLFAMSTFYDGARRLGSITAAAVHDELHEAVRRTIEGQAIELGWHRDGRVDVRPQAYIEMVLLKTCAYTTVYPIRVGALIAGRNGADLDALTAFAAPLGVAFQVRDDLLSLERAGAAGKDALGDLFEAKRSLAMIHLLQAAAPAEARFLRRFLRQRRRTAAAVDTVLTMMHERGSIAFAQSVADQLADEARARFAVATGTASFSAATGFIAELIDYVVTREA